jgi:transcriptional regulator with GAF, ATPase, and Fis domain
VSEQTRTVFLEGGAETLKLRKYSISIESGVDQGSRQVFTARRVELGSSPDNGLVLSDPAVSRFHARIEVDANGYHLRDMGSKNGTWIGDLRVMDVFLEPGAVFRLGSTLLRFAVLDEEVDIHFSGRKRFGGMLGQSIEMRQIFGLLERVAPTDATVLVEGESGTGKELIAQAIHEHSRRKDGPFVVFDCSAVPRDLIESELFGHMRGAFTGATSDRKGAFEQAHGGTLFLDELGELELDLQPKLLRVLEQREVKPVGAAQPRKVDVRIVAATNRNLLHEVRAGNFREDLYYRFEIIKVKLPPLRERKEDIALLIKHFIEKFSESSGRPVNIAYSTMEKLQRHHWPGNVRELKNFVERAALLADSDRLETRYLNLPRTSLEAPPQPEAPLPSDSHLYFQGDLPFKEAKNHLVEEFEKRYWMRLLSKTDGNVSKAARVAGVHRKSVEYILKKLDLSRDDLPS